MRSFALRIATTLIAASFTLGVSACSDDGISSDVGEIKDTFAKPTAHGDLQFGLDNQAAFTDDERFHAWTFTLSADAEVKLTTSVDAPNLDTVAYLYKKAPGKTTWGSSIKKNHDTGGALTSKIEAKLGAGEYQLRIKAKKDAMRGGFAVQGACTGQGCPSTGSCSADDIAELPSGGFGPSCAAALAEVLLAPVTSTASTEVTFPERCSLDATSKLAVDLYRRYFDDFFIGWDTVAEDGEPDLTVEDTHHDGGARVVRVEVTGSDEMALDFVFDASGKLVVAHHHEQSPTDLWFCGDGALEEPDPFCAGHALWQVPHRADDEQNEKGTVKFSQASTALSPLLARAAAHYKAATSATSNMNLNYDGASWTLGAPDEGADVTFSATNRPTYRYVAGISNSTATLFFRFEGTNAELVCESLD